MTARQLAKRIADSMLSKKGHDVVIMDLRGLSSAADYFVICTADSDVQVRAIADAIEMDSIDERQYPWHTEGRRAGLWVIQDYVDVVAHVFHKEARVYYNLERLWSDAKTTSVHDTVPKKAAAKPRTKKGSSRKKSA